MKIGILGSGNIGGTLGKHWATAGHEIFFSSRHPEQLQPLATTTGAQVGTPKEAAAFGDVLLLAIPYGKVPELAQQLGPLNGKIIIDATNPYPHRDGPMAQTIIDDPQRTATDFVAECFPDNSVVKAFNSIYFKVLDGQAFQKGEAQIAVQVASNVLEAKTVVMGLIEDIGFAPQDLGNLAESPIFEPGGPLYNQNLPIPAARALLEAQG